MRSLCVGECNGCYLSPCLCGFHDHNYAAYFLLKQKKLKKKNFPTPLKWKTLGINEKKIFLVENIGQVGGIFSVAFACKKYLKKEWEI